MLLTACIGLVINMIMAFSLHGGHGGHGKHKHNKDVKHEHDDVDDDDIHSNESISYENENISDKININ